MSWLSAVASVGGALLGSSSAKKASKAQERAAEAQIGYAREARDLIRGDQEPYREAGYSALQQLMRLTGVPVPTSVAQAGAPGTWRGGDEALGLYDVPKSGKATEFDVQQAFNQYVGRPPTETELKYYTGRERANQLYQDAVVPNRERVLQQRQSQGGVVGGAPEQSIDQMVKADPSYNFRLNEGMRALERSKAAGGGLLSGGTARGLTRYAQDYASTEYGKIYDRIANIAGLGQTGVAQSASGTFNTGAMMGGAASDAGFSRASGYLAQGRVWGNALEDLASADWSGVGNVFKRSPRGGSSGGSSLPPGLF